MSPNVRSFLAAALMGCAPQPNGAEPASATSSATATLPEPPPAPSSSGPSVVASAVPSVTAEPAVTASATAVPAAEAPPDVDVKNIGMHIGGGPNDAETKAPIKKSVEPHMASLARCFVKADSKDKGGDVSLDLKIDKAGGKAELKKYKSGIDGAEFETCVRDVFATIDFLKPKTGTTVVSYSLRFTPKKN